MMKNLLYILLLFPLALFGQQNYSLSFDEGSSILFSKPFFNNPEEFTIALDIKFSSQAYEFSREFIRHGQGGEFHISTMYGMLKFSIKSGESWYSTEIAIPDTTNWHTLIARYSTILDFMSIEINDNVSSIEFLNNTMHPYNHTPYIGGHQDFHINHQWFEGALDNLCIWDRCLSMAESELMTFPINDSSQINDFIGYWNFNEGTGNAVYDLSINDNHGTSFGVTYSNETPEDFYIGGCLDSSAVNYNDSANIDDGSCVSLEEYTIDSLEIVNQVLLEESSLALSSLQQALDTWNTKIDLVAGWNMFGYGCPAPIDLVQAMSENTDNIIILKDNSGKVYMPEFGFNGIGDLTPGLGYQIKVTEAIEGFSLCDWYVNDIPEDNIVSLQEENASMKAELDSLYGCMDEGSCNFDSTAVLNDSSCDYETCLDECGVINGDNTTCLDCAGVPNGTTEDLGCGCGNPAAQEGYDCEGNEITSYRVGDLAHGGIVFYVDETGQHGLVVALEDLGSFEWGCYGMGIPGADGQAIGTGYQNTLDVVNQGCTSEDGGITAAQAALDAEINGYSDWYLPSKDELKEMYNTIGNGGSEGNIGGFETSDWPYCWSSSEGYHGVAWGVYFGNGATYTNYKHYSYRVRVIRAF